MLIKSYKERGKALLFQRDNYLTLASINSLWFHTIPKSATTFFIVFIANYLKHLSDGNEKHLGLKEITEKHFIHTIENQINKKDLCAYHRNRNNLIESYGYQDLISTHAIIKGSAWKKYLFLYRSPLDWLVSYYFYRYVNRRLIKNINYVRRSPQLIFKKDPRQIMELELPLWIENFKFYQETKQNRPDDSFGLSFESLMDNKTEGLEAILKFLSIPVDHEVLNTCIQNAGKEKTYDGKEGNLIGKNLTTGFVRGGKPGEWKSYFGEKDIDKARGIFSNHGLDLDEFIQTSG